MLYFSTPIHQVPHTRACSAPSAGETPTYVELSLLRSPPSTRHELSESSPSVRPTERLVINAATTTTTTAHRTTHDQPRREQYCWPPSLSTTAATTLLSWFVVHTHIVKIVCSVRSSCADLSLYFTPLSLGCHSRHPFISSGRTRTTSPPPSSNIYTKDHGLGAFRCVRACVCMCVSTKHPTAKYRHTTGEVVRLC